jgi:hypothetical protein
LPLTRADESLIFEDELLVFNAQSFVFKYESFVSGYESLGFTLFKRSFMCEYRLPVNGLGRPANPEEGGRYLQPGCTRKPDRHESTKKPVVGFVVGDGHVSAGKIEWQGHRAAMISALGPPTRDLTGRCCFREIGNAIRHELSCGICRFHIWRQNREIFMLDRHLAQE